MTEVRKLPQFFDKWREGWSDPDALEPENYLDDDVALKAVIMAQWLFSPNFVEYRGGIYLHHYATERNVDHWLERPDLELADIEELLNTVHLWSVFGHCDLDELGDDVLDELARSLGGAWRGALLTRFPDRVFTVSVEDTMTGSYGPGVTFFCNRQ